MKSLIDLPNIGKILAAKLDKVGIKNENELKEIRNKNVLIKIAPIENGDACLNMLYALEGAIQGIRWHGLHSIKKQELKNFYRLMNK